MLFQVALLVYSFAYIPILFWRSTTFTSYFTAHPVLMCVAYALTCYGISIFSQRPKTEKGKASKNDVTKHKILSDMHGAAQFVAVVMLLIAFGIIEYSKFANNRSHFVSWHGTVGFGAALAFLGIGSFGFMMKNLPVTMISVMKRLGGTYSQGWKLHRYAGFLMLSVFYSVLFMGQYTSWMLSQADQYRKHSMQFGDYTVKYSDFFWGTGLGLQTVLYVGAMKQLLKQ
ncbi:hypothetical protein MP638_003983 [Amoeboaphelidium occidentale]|nr:hypothetical protein MP638_003983 [Amoeboaphelidium occidentale]